MADADATLTRSATPVVKRPRLESSCEDDLPPVGNQDGDGHNEIGNARNIPHDNLGRSSDVIKEAYENDVEDQESVLSDLSGLSDLSNLSEPTPGPISWVHQQMLSGTDPRVLLKDLIPHSEVIPDHVPDHAIWRIIIGILSELHEPKRSKLNHINTLDDAIGLLHTCQKIIVLTGAGVSVSCGIPDFRSKNGIYARLSVDFPDLPDPQSMFDINYFKKDPRPFFKFAKEIYPGQFEASLSHRFIKLLEEKNKLLRNYTQNIDTLEHSAGIKNVITCHGSFATATCTTCHYTVNSSLIKDDILNQKIPYCDVCPSDAEERGIMKPNIVFFGEGLSNEFYDTLTIDKDVCDLLIVIGSSLKVRPVATIPHSVPTIVPQILINREPLKHLNFDVELLGDCDVIIGELCHRLREEWEIDEFILTAPLKETKLSHSALLPSSLGSFSSEMNNNKGSPKQAERSHPSGYVVPPSEESNSCDYHGLSAIKLDDSEDSSNQSQQELNSVEQETTELHTFCSISQEKSKLQAGENMVKLLPEGCYFFVPPNRYIFHGAEVYVDSEVDENCSTSHSSISKSPPRSSSPSSSSSSSDVNGVGGGGGDDSSSEARFEDFTVVDKGGTLECVETSRQ